MKCLGIVYGNTFSWYKGQFDHTTSDALYIIVQILIELSQMKILERVTYGMQMNKTTLNDYL